jgi:hypothetical protein
MAAFSHLITASSPHGFHSACDQLNELVEQEESGEELVSLSSRLYSEGLAAADTKKWAEEVKALLFILHCYKEVEVKPSEKEIAAALDLNTFLSRTAIAFIVRCMATVKEIDATIEATSGSETPVEVMNRKLSNYGRLSNLKWRLGVALASSKSKNLSAPYVSLSFDVTTSDGSTRKETMEMTYLEFMDFYGKMAAVDEAMGTL